jgi:prepilin-type N-terminal cleavage/methylation domain-containing protein
MQRARPAYTLFELMLVMALLAILTALAIPSLEAMIGQYRLNAAVDQVRGALATARAHAVDEGQAYRFEMQPNGNSYRIAPDDASSPTDNGSAPAAGDSSTPLVLEETLPKGIQLSLTDALTGAGLASADPGTAAGVAIFLPDGTTRQDLELLFQGKGARSRILSLRALTGIITVRNAQENGARNASGR